LLLLVLLLLLLLTLLLLPLQVARDIARSFKLPESKVVHVKVRSRMKLIKVVDG
jgi:hypothetical protein